MINKEALVQADRTLRLKIYSRLCQLFPKDGQGDIMLGVRGW